MLLFYACIVHLFFIWFMEQKSKMFDFRFGCFTTRIEGTEFQVNIIHEGQKLLEIRLIDRERWGSWGGRLESGRCYPSVLATVGRRCQGRRFGSLRLFDWSCHDWRYEVVKKVEWRDRGVTYRGTRLMSYRWNKRENITNPENIFDVINPTTTPIQNSFSQLEKLEKMSSRSLDWRYIEKSQLVSFWTVYNWVDTTMTFSDVWIFKMDSLPKKKERS